MTPRVTQAHLEARRREIMEAGLRCLSRRGLHATTMQEIADEAGLSVGALYRYFENKEELVRALAVESAERRRDRVEALGTGTAKMSGSTPLARLVSDLLQGLETENARETARLDVRLWGELLESSVGRDIVRETFAETRALIASSVQVGGETRDRERDRSVRRADPDAVGRLVVSMLAGLELQLAYEPELDLAAYRGAVRACLAGL